jgi:hypothetical protein
MSYTSYFKSKNVRLAVKANGGYLAYESGGVTYPDMDWNMRPELFRPNDTEKILKAINYAESAGHDPEVVEVRFDVNSIDGNKKKEFEEQIKKTGINKLTENEKKLLGLT